MEQVMSSGVSVEIETAHGVLVIKKLGLAAYIKIMGTRLVKVDRGNVFHFQTDRDEQSWMMEYSNSESYRHDTEVMNLRELAR